eukprot:CAMPEP_0202867528 /NCGR_PEP_ID=MMETSP1391-20130828/9483_1 /ASSEMBLY_ACC=CAM_ASM_000867 /TAXON_ID=1034604 /ORGANISM="Chlamydomonas leiostraca, Strain SAG 11-49" /LENGTH=429 /DNA_ID=CAMNT_0049547581 /DNA_START=14 /DNA_END=1303 /DNA_ORIENTATION=-
MDGELDEQHFVALLTKLVGEAKHLQNNPPENIPVEDRAGRHVLDALAPFGEDNGGPLKIKHISYVEGRGNIIVEYPGEPGGGIISFVGCHLDVVTANPETWHKDPFTLTVEGDKLWGRGTTDCLGHVALLTELFRHLGATRPKLRRTVVGVWIANEENSKVLGIGVDELVKRGEMSHLKQGPLYWVDVADSQPCIGTGGILAWQLTAHGKMFHSGIPHKAVNPIELAMEGLRVMQDRFYQDFPAHPEEARYGYAIPSTMKPTQWRYPGGSINQIPGEATVCGDCRMTPFYDLDKVKAALEGYVAAINADLGSLPVHGPASKYELPEEEFKGRLELKFFDASAPGVACNLDSEGHKVMLKAFEDVYGSVKPYAITGSLPCIKELQDEGYDVQCTGFGKMATYHANNEYALLSDYKQGYRVLCRLVERFNS